MGKLKNNLFLRRWGYACREAGACLSLGVRDGMKSKVLTYSILVTLLATGVMIWFYYTYPGIPAATSLWMAATSVFGGGATLSFGGGRGVVPSPNPVAMAQVVYLLLVTAGVAAMYSVLLFAFGVLALVLLVLPVTVLPQAVMRISALYPDQCAALPSLPPAYTWWTLLRQAGWIVLILLFCLLLPVVAGAVVLGVLASLNLLLLYAATVRALPQAIPRVLALRWRWRPMCLIGFVLLVLICIPLLNLLVPAVMCATMVHLSCRDNRYCLPVA
jgi:hypothetical protein